IQYYLRFWLGICRTSLAVSALRIMRYCPWFFIQTGKRFVPRALTSLFRGELSLNFKKQTEKSVSSCPAWHSGYGFLLYC
ncbi:MAG: hypothetical protein ACLUJU_00480, partial [Subdoligranulum sp.]